MQGSCRTHKAPQRFAGSHFIFRDGSKFRLRQGLGSAKTLGRRLYGGSLTLAGRHDPIPKTSQATKAAAASITGTARGTIQGSCRTHKAPQRFAGSHFIFRDGSKFRLRQGLGSAKTLGRRLCGGSLTLAGRHDPIPKTSQAAKAAAASITGTARGTMQGS